MPAQLTFTGIVLKKTKLGETDLIVTFLAQDGSTVQAVARGARKPKSSFASRLELFSCVELFCASTKGLPLVQEARLLQAHEPLRLDFDRSTAASVIAELIAKCTYENVATPRLFELCNSAFAALSRTNIQTLYALALATCLKVFAFVGVRPRFSHCASCGKEIIGSGVAEREDVRAALGQPETIAFSYLEGGSLCDACASSFEVVREQTNLVKWLNVLLYATFEQVKSYNVPAPVLSFGFHFVQSWTNAHFGARLKSVPFLLTNASFPATTC